MSDLNNIFKTQPRWIAEDKRQTRPVVVESPGKPGGPSLSYNINADFMFDRHRVMLSPELIKGKSILDIGSLLGATGAWCLANGAKSYTGLEAQQDFVDHSNNLFAEYFPNGGWENITEAIETFETDRKWDIVIASGVLYACFDSFDFIKRVSSWANETVIFDTVHPFNGYRRLFPDASDDDRLRVSTELSIVQPSERIRMNIAALGHSVRIAASIVSVRALALMMKNQGFDYDPLLYSQAETEMPYYYDIRQHNRYMAKFFVSNVGANLFEKALEDPHNFEVASVWNGNSTPR
tara:strand:- start:2079 stop:2960 length:882 start_codon:yes stop_codon:yes gene_type:complete